MARRTSVYLRSDWEAEENSQSRTGELFPRFPRCKTLKCIFRKTNPYAHGINCFVNRQLIYTYPKSSLAEIGIKAIEHADFEGVETREVALDHRDLMRTWSSRWVVGFFWTFSRVQPAFYCPLWQQAKPNLHSLPTRIQCTSRNLAPLSVALATFILLDTGCAVPPSCAGSVSAALLISVSKCSDAKLTQAYISKITYFAFVALALVKLLQLDRSASCVSDDSLPISFSHN